MNPVSETCRHLKSLLPDYINGELEAVLCAELERHISGCDNCRIIVDTLRKTVTLYREYGRAEVPGEVHERLVRVLKFDRPKEGPPTG